MHDTPPQSEASGAGTEPAWYACYTRARHEKRVDLQLRERGWDAYLPLVPRERQWHDRKKVVEFPLFASYIFVRATRPTLSQVLATPGIATVVRFNGRPIPVPDEDIANVRRLVSALRESGRGFEPVPLVEKGNRVAIVDGPFQGIEGIVLERRGAERALVQVGVRAIGRGVKIEVETRELEVLEASGGTP